MRHKWDLWDKDCSGQVHIIKALKDKGSLSSVFSCAALTQSCNDPRILLLAGSVHLEVQDLSHAGKTLGWTACIQHKGMGPYQVWVTEGLHVLPAADVRLLNVVPGPQALGGVAVLSLVQHFSHPGNDLGVDFGQMPKGPSPHICCLREFGGAEGSPKVASIPYLSIAPRQQT